MNLVLVLIIVAEAILGLVLFLRAREVAKRIQSTQTKIESLEAQLKQMQETDLRVTKQAVSNIKERVAVFEGRNRPASSSEHQILEWVDKVPALIDVFKSFALTDNTNGKRREKSDSAE